MSQTSLFDGVGIVWRSCELDAANGALIAWGHKMGPMLRPDYGDLSCQALYHDGKMVAVTCVAGLVREAVGGAPWLTRTNAVELALLCAERPGLCRVAIRLWREFTFPNLHRDYAVSYQDSDLHTGNVYRFDGWQKVAESKGSSSIDQRTGRRGRNKVVWIWPPITSRSTVVAA